jgi:hypothetical protein
MKPRSTAETAIFCSTGLIALALLLFGVHVAASENGSSKPLIMMVVCGLAALAIFVGYRYLIVRKTAQLELTGSEHYRQLADEYRRLTDMAITAQEHTDLKLGELSAQLDHLREQNDSLQKILKEVE